MHVHGIWYQVSTFLLAGCVCGAACAQSLVSGEGGEIARGGRFEFALSSQPMPESERRADESEMKSQPSPKAQGGARLQRIALLRATSDGLGLGGRPHPGLGPDDLMALATRAHPEVVAKRAEVDVANATLDAARWNYFPTPSIEMRQQNKDGNISVVAVQQPLWVGGRLDAEFDAAEARTRSAGVAVSEAQYSLALRVMDAWQSWLQARGRIDALVRGIAMLETYGESVRKRIQSGVSPEIDQRLVESRISQANGDLTSARAAERSALTQLSLMTGRTLRTDELFYGSSVVGAMPAFEVLAEQAVVSSTTLRRLEADIEASRHDAAQKRAALWPTISIRGEYQRNVASSSSDTAQDSRVMLVLGYTPGAGLSARAGISAAEAQANSLQASLEAARRNLVAKVAADYEDHLSSVARKYDLQATIRSAYEVLVSYDRLFVAGKRSWLDVLNAARELMQHESSLADVEALRLASHHRLRLYRGEFPWQNGAAL
ncbi:TolC family protein [Azonexus fungiphilus]|nr:TolC family protein [Azonexus fungiphilus]